MEAEKSSPDSSAQSRPGPRPGVLAARPPAARASGADLRPAPTLHRGRNPPPPPRFGEVGAGPEGVRGRQVGGPLARVPLCAPRPARGEVARPNFQPPWETPTSHRGTRGRLSGAPSAVPGAGAGTGAGHREEGLGWRFAEGGAAAAWSGGGNGGRRPRRPTPARASAPRRARPGDPGVRRLAGSAPSPGWRPSRGR